MDIPNEHKRALVLGASGLVGAELLKILLERSTYTKVFALVRSALPIKHPNLEVVVCEMDERTAIEQALTEIEASDVFCCLGTTIKRAGSQEAFRKVDVELPFIIAQIMSNRGLQHFLIVTAIGSNPNSSVFYSRMKGVVEQKLRELKIPQLSIFRPSLLLGKRREFRLGEKLSIIISSGFRFAMVGPLQKYKPIHANQVALAMVLQAGTTNTEKDNDGIAVTVFENHEMFRFIEKLR